MPSRVYALGYPSSADLLNKSIALADDLGTPFFPSQYISAKE